MKVQMNPQSMNLLLYIETVFMNEVAYMIDTVPKWIGNMSPERYFIHLCPFDMPSQHEDLIVLGIRIKEVF